MKNLQDYSIQNTQNDDLDTLQDKANNFMERANDLKDKAGNKIEETIEDVRKKSAEAQSAVIDYVKENPVQALGLAALAGIVIGVVLRK